MRGAGGAALNSPHQPFWRRFGDGIPDYLARHYWWAYLARPGVWFFDHETVISAILFGAYRELVEATLASVVPGQRTLMIAHVYGGFVPLLAARLQSPLVLVDVAPVQLALARTKARAAGVPIRLVRMNAEQLGFADDAFGQVIVFFLWHEMPREARWHSRLEAVRVLAPGGRLIVVDYAPLDAANPLARIRLWRLLMQWLEPFLADFWREDPEGQLMQTIQVRFGHAPRVWKQRTRNGLYVLQRFDVADA